MAEAGAIGIAVSIAVLGSLGISVAKGMNVQNNQRIASGGYKKKERNEKRRSNKGKRHIPITSAS